MPRQKFEKQTTKRITKSPGHARLFISGPWSTYSKSKTRLWPILLKAVALRQQENVPELMQKSERYYPKTEGARSKAGPHYIEDTFDKQ